MVISGEVIFRIKTKEGDLIWNSTLKRGDLLYIPRGTTYQMKSKVQPEQKGYTVVVVLSNFRNHTWRNIVEKSVSASLKGAEFLNERLPNNIFDRSYKE